MTFNSRFYVYGVMGDSEEFLHTFLDAEGATAYIKKHQQLFGGRFEKYYYCTANKAKRTYVSF